MPTTNETRYFMEDPREKQRLADKVDPNEWAQQYLSRLVRPESKVLDVGCGPAVIAAAVARTYPQATVTGLERSDDRFAEATANLAELPSADVIQGSATAMPFADNSYDVVYTRFMLEYLRERETAIAEMVRVCRPGGQVMLQDLDGQLVWHYPIDPQLQEKLDRVIGFLETTGFDPYLGRKLFSMARSAGLTDVQVQCEPYHFYAGRIDEKNDALWELKLDIALPMMAQALGSEAEAKECKQQFLDHLRSEDTLTYSNVFTVVGTKRE